MILMFDGVGTFNEIFRNFFGGIDKLVYSLVGWVLQGIFNLSDLTANTGLVEIIYKRIYVVLAIFMVFKLTFSFLQYMINPESMTDKERGVGKIIVRIVIMLAMIVALPILFFEPVISVNGQDKTILTALQDGVIETLPRIILGINVKDDSNLTSTAAEQGREMAVRMLQAFYYPATCSSDSGANTDYENSQCYKMMSETPMNNLDDFSDSLLNDTNSDDIYDYGYMWPMSTIAGIALVVILLGMAVDVAVRVFKLLILQLIAPVPVMSYIDPKSSKDGAFSSWTKNFISTYLDIFIKLGTVYLLLLLISEMFNLFGFEDSSGIYDKYGFFNGSFILVFLIIGLFKFAKDAPKFIKEAIGIKDSGGGGLFGGLQTLGAAAGVLGGATAGLVGGVAGGVAAAKAAGQGKGMAALKGVGSGLSGLARGGVQGGKGAAKGNLLKGMSGAIAAQNAVTQRNLAAAAGGSTLRGRMQARAEDFFGISNPDDVALEDAKNLSAAAANLKTIRDTAESKGFQDRTASIGNVSYTDSNGVVQNTNFAQGEHAFFKDLYENAAREGKSDFVFNGQTVDMITAGAIYKELTTAVSDNFLSNYTGGNAAIDSALNEYNQNIDAVSTKNSAGFTTLTSVSVITDAYSKGVSRQGNAVKASVDPAKVRKHKADREANKRNGK